MDSTCTLVLLLCRTVLVREVDIDTPATGKRRRVQRLHGGRGMVPYHWRSVPNPDAIMFEWFVMGGLRNVSLSVAFRAVER